jgi:hypothetical protein
MYLVLNQKYEVNNKIFDKDCVASIQCKDAQDGLEKAHKLFPGFVFYLYKRLPKMEYFSRGVVCVE